MPPVRKTSRPTQIPEVDRKIWVELGVHSTDIAKLSVTGFKPFEAAIAQDGGFTPSIAVSYRHQLCRTANTWKRRRLDLAEGLEQCRSGFVKTDATRWRAKGGDIASIRVSRNVHSSRSARFLSPAPKQIKIRREKGDEYQDVYHQYSQ